MPTSFTEMWMLLPRNTSGLRFELCSWRCCFLVFSGRSCCCWCGPTTFALTSPFTPPYFVLHRLSTQKLQQCICVALAFLSPFVFSVLKRNFSLGKYGMRGSCVMNDKLSFYREPEVQETSACGNLFF